MQVLPDPKDIAFLKKSATRVPQVLHKVPAVDGILKKLKVTPEIRAIMQAHIAAVGLDYRNFGQTQAEQDQAFILLTELSVHIPLDFERDARSKLTIITSDKNTVNATDKSAVYMRHRRVYQCQCGVNNHKGHQGGKTREIGWENVGCGFWVRLTSTHDEQENSVPVLLTIDEIFGDFTHSPECLDSSVMSRNPRIPLHPELREYALALLQDRVPLPQLKQHCRDWAHKRWGLASGNSTYRFTLNDSETTSLYRTLARKIGIPQRSTAQNNLDIWFRANNPNPPDPRLTASCISYIPYIPGETERFSIIISTPQQREMAWKYGHHKQILMDLTFGVCSGRALLAILMVIDEQNKGIPIAQLMFTAKKETKAVHADYDRELLKEQLGFWKSGMGKNAAGEQFEPYVGNTDNDTRERYGLQEHWKDILLLLCMFHIWQCWRNGLGKHLRVIPKGDARLHVRRHLAKFLMRLLKEINDYEVALEAYNQELVYFKTLLSSKDPVKEKQGKGGLAFLTYLQSYLKVRDFWRSWSIAGAMEAADRMHVPLSAVLRTTNHLESFNGRLKGRYFAPYLHSGRLPRIDYWIHTLITQALPTFFDEWAAKRNQKEYYVFMRQAPSVAEKSKPSNPNDVTKAAKKWAAEVFACPKTKDYQAVRRMEDEYDEALQALENSMIASLEDSDDGSDDKGDVEDMEDFGMHLQVSDDGERSFAADINMASLSSVLETHCKSVDVEPPQTHRDYPTTVDMSYSFGDMALDDSAILEDLSNIDLEAPYCAQPPQDTSTTSFLLPSPPRNNSNQQATAMLDLLRAEDLFVDALKAALDAGISRANLEPHLSCSARERIFRQTPCLLTSHVFVQNAPPPQRPTQRARQPSISEHPIRLPYVPAPAVPRLLPDFDLQRKSKRHPSYGLR